MCRHAEAARIYKLMYAATQSHAVTNSGISSTGGHRSHIGFRHRPLWGVPFPCGDKKALRLGGWCSS